MDIVGESSVTAEIELLAAACEFFRSLGLGPDLVGFRVNSRQVLERLGGDPSIYVIVDKIDKIGPAAVKDLLLEKMPEAKADRIIASLSAKLDEVDAPDLKKLFELAKDYGIEDYLDFDASVVRGLAYYTGVVFEAFDRSGQFRAICGGGRYDKLLELYGGCKIPCCGFGFGDCVIMELLKELKMLPVLKPQVDFVVAPFSEEEQGPAASVAKKLREAGYTVNLALAPRRARQAFDLANRNGAKRVAFVGPDEWQRGLVRVKDMHLKDSKGEGIQIDVPFDDLHKVDTLFHPPLVSPSSTWALVPTAKFAVVTPPKL